MKQHPILFSTPMVSALLSGQKTMTRRTRGLEKVNKNPDGYDFQSLIHEFRGRFIFMPSDKIFPNANEIIEVKCPYGKPGDQLWVRESFCYVMRDHAHDLLEGRKENNQYVFKTDFNEDWMKYAKEKYGYKWKPSIHMPRIASRILLEITDVRVERLQSITKQDSIAEGIEILDGHSNYKNYLCGNGLDYSYVKEARISFQSLWEKINGTDSWHKNPWVWVVSFKRI